MDNFFLRLFLLLTIGTLIVTSRFTVVGAASTADDVLSHFEIDIIFPRNETYETDNIFPIVIAFQNITALEALGSDYVISWDIMPYSSGVVPGGITYDDGNFTTLDIGSRDTEDQVILVATSNATAWIYRKQDRDERFMLQWHVVWPEARDRCGNENRFVFGGLMFNIQTPGEQSTPSSTAAAISVPFSCPVRGSVANIQSNGTVASCPVVAIEDNATGTPCSVQIDRDVASSISGRATALASSVQQSTETTAMPSSTNAAIGLGSPVHTAVAAACALGFLAY